ncbi:hypothetical protein ACPA9J_24220 [Pseudomonas aeruginosa]
MLPNIPPDARGALWRADDRRGAEHTLNVRLDAEAIAFMLQHGEAKVLITDYEFHEVIHAAIGMLDHPPLVVDVNDPEYGEGRPVGELDYRRRSPRATRSSPGNGPGTSGRRSR